MVSKRTFLRRSCQDNSFQRRPWLLQAPFPSATCLPSQTVLHNWFSKQRQVLSLSCHSLAQQRQTAPSLGPQDWDTESRWQVSAGLSRGCWEMAGPPGVTRGVVWWRWGKGLQISLWILQREALSRGPGTGRPDRLRDLQGQKGSDKFQPTTHWSGGETEAQGKKGSWPEQALSSFLHGSHCQS